MISCIMDHKRFSESTFGVLFLEKSYKKNHRYNYSSWATRGLFSAIYWLLLIGHLFLWCFNVEMVEIVNEETLIHHNFTSFSRHTRSVQSPKIK